MTRTYHPTGRPRGRPRKDAQKIHPGKWGEGDRGGEKQSVRPTEGPGEMCASAATPRNPPQAPNIDKSAPTQRNTAPTMPQDASKSIPPHPDNPPGAIMAPSSDSRPTAPAHQLATHITEGQEARQ